MRTLLLTLILVPAISFGQTVTPKGAFLSDAKSITYDGRKLAKGDTLQGSTVKAIKKYESGYYALLDNGNYIALKLSDDYDDLLGQDEHALARTYTASNGVTYNEGDNLEMGHGANPNGSYQYVIRAGFGAVMSYDANRGFDQLDAARGFAGLRLPILKIRTDKYMGQPRVYFIVKAVGGRYCVWIENAISTCEVTPCNKTKNEPNKFSAADEIMKYKKLLEAGAITQEEYDKKKAELLAK